MLFMLNLPNDFGSEADDQAAFVAAYGEDAEHGSASTAVMYRPIWDAASDAGLHYVRDTDFGAVWTGSEAQFRRALEAMPEWARPYASQVNE